MKIPHSNYLYFCSNSQVFSCEFSEISKNTYFTEHLHATASATLFLLKSINVSMSPPTANFFNIGNNPSQPVITCSKLAMETLEQGVRYVQS